MTNDKNSAVLIVGAGIAGMGAAMHLAALGYPVHLLETGPAIGGSMHLLDHTFPTNSCGLCLMLPHQPAFCPTFECQQQPAIHLLPYAELVALDGEPGAFRATVRHKARYVDDEACTGCGDCAAVCPVARPHDHEGCLAPVKAIYRPPGLRAVPDTWVIDMNYCTRCGACVDACPERAIHLEMQPREEQAQVGAVLLTPGFAPFDLRRKGEYGYGVYDNVLSALEFERMVSLAGSSGGRLLRFPSGVWRPGGSAPTPDRRAPMRVGFVHCVGSRDPLCGAGHCSSACCMFTAKQVALAKQIDPDLEVTVFHMDLRAFGKGFDAYLDGVQALPGVTYRRAMPSSVKHTPSTGELAVTYVGEGGRLAEEAFDLLVLATGFAPPAGIQALARGLGVELNAYGFALTDGYHLARTGRAGVFVAGAFREPKDIPDTVAEAAAAAAEVAAFLQAPPPAGEEPPREAPPRDLSDEEPRVGVFVCDCRPALTGLDLPHLVAWAAGQRGVALAQVVPAGCTAEGQAALRAAIQAEGLNRVVVAGCSHRLFADEFEGLMRRVGLDPRLLARVNLREQVAYPHAALGADVTGKACSLLGMAVAGLRAMAGLEALARPATPSALLRRAVVVGGGAAGMSAALTLARLQIPVELVEQAEELGGQWRHIRFPLDGPSAPLPSPALGTGSDPQAALAEMIGAVQAEPRITVHRQTRVSSLAGRPGHYRTSLTTDGGEQTLEHGALIVATGGGPAPAREYLYGHDPRVLTQRELEEQLTNGTLAAVQSVVMVQCVGSREPERPYCSRVCCTQAVKNALRLKQVRPDVEVYVLYREVRTFGFREAYYQAAREAGVVFLRYELPAKPQVEAQVPPETSKGQRPYAPQELRGLRVRLTEPVTGQPLELAADLLVLSVGMDPEPGDGLAALGVARDGDGFFREEHAKMKPLDLGKGGLYVAGLAHSPRFLEEAIAQGQAAAMRAAAYLAPGEMVERPTAVWVNERLCSFCGLCVEACPFEARVMDYDQRVAIVDPGLCQGCGVCAMVCPNKATRQKAFEHQQLLAAVDMALV